MPVSIGGPSGVNYHPSQIGSYTPSSSSVQRSSLSIRRYECRGLGHIRRYYPNFLSAGQLTQQLASTALVPASHNGRENGRGHP